QEDGRLELNLDMKKIKYRSDAQGIFPISTCATPCEPHQIKVRERDDTCCWKCRDCGRYQIKHDAFHCDDCKMGETPDPTHSRCEEIPEKYIDYRNAWAIGAMGFAALGMFTTVFVALVFWGYNDTPIIKAAGRELSYILLLGIFLSFSVTFVIVAEPDPFTCGLMRFFLGFCPALCYAAIVTKTNRIARIFHHKPGTSAPKTKYISPTSQMIIVGMLTAVEVLINIVWILWDPPQTTYIYPDRSTKLRICEGVDTYRYMVGVIYPLVLLVFCTIYAIQTRKCPGGFNETKYIAFTNYTIIIIWLAFVPLYLASTSNSIRVVTLAISMSLSGFVELACLFFPKIYIVLLKPEKNTKEVVMAPNRSSFATLSNSHGITNFGHHLPSSGNSFSRPHSSFCQSENGIVITATRSSSPAESC
ncbi:unnamed protein product, partial [Allacma fusca]